MHGWAHLCRVEVVNLAVAGDSPTRRLERMKKEAGRWNADWLLCDASALDSWLEDNHIHSVLQRGIADSVPVRRGSHPPLGRDGGRLARGLSRQVSGRVGAIAREASTRPGAQEAARLQVPLTVLILPRGDSKAKSPRVFQLIRSLCVQNGLDFIDISGAFDQMEVEEFRVSDWDKHPNARGHRVMFEALRDAILRRGQLPGLRPRLRSLRTGDHWPSRAPSPNGPA